MQPGYRTTPETEEERQEREDYFTQASRSRASQINTEDPGFLQNAVNTFNNINRMGADDEPLTYVNPETGEEQEVEVQNLQYTPAMAGKLGVGLNLPSAGNLIRAGIAGASAIGATHIGANMTDYLQRMSEQLEFDFDIDADGNVDTQTETQTETGGPSETPPGGPNRFQRFIKGMPGYGRIRNLVRFGGPLGVAGAGVAGTFNEGQDDPTAIDADQLEQDYYSNLPEFLQETPESVGRTREEEILENLALQERGVQESYSNLYARAMQDAFRRRAASTTPFTGISGGQQSQVQQALSAAEINQLGQIGADYSQMMRDIEGMRLAAPQQAREAELEQYAIQQQAIDRQLQTQQAIQQIMDSGLTDEQKAAQIAPLVNFDQQTIDALFADYEENQGQINWNTIAIGVGLGGLFGGTKGAAVGAVSGGAYEYGSRLAENVVAPALMDTDWFQRARVYLRSRYPNLVND